MIAGARNASATKSNFKEKTKAFVRIILKVKTADMELKGRPRKDALESHIRQTKLWCLQDEELSRVRRAYRNGIREIAIGTECP